MITKISLVAIVVSLVMQANFSCKKETSCEGCRQNNKPPIAIAGFNLVITLPIDSVSLDGSASNDPDGLIKGYTWRKIDGPASFHISNANAIQVLVTNLVQGIYEFELEVTDAGGLFSKDTTQVTVMNQPIICNECKIVFVSTRDGNPEIYSCNGDGSKINRLTYDEASDDEPVWSPDHSKIAFISNRSGVNELYIMSPDGSDVVRKTFSGANNPAWSPDGTKIAYSTLSSGSANIWVVGTTNGSPSLLFEAPGWDAHPSWSPDGRKIVLVSDWAAYDFVYDIYTINADGTGFTAITGNIFDALDYLHPSWSPDGTKFALAISHEAGINEYVTQVGVMRINGTELSAIRSGAAPWTTTSWSGDGTRIVYTSLSGSRRDVSWVAVDGSSSGTIVTNGWNADWQH